MRVLHATIRARVIMTKEDGMATRPIVRRGRNEPPPHSRVFMPKRPVKKVKGRKITVKTVKIMTERD